MNLESHLLELETRLHQPELRASAQALMELMDEEFLEFGASGAVWTRDAVIQTLCGERGAGECVAHSPNR
jgi:glyoxylase I family protein